MKSWNITNMDRFIYCIADVGFLGVSTPVFTARSVTLYYSQFYTCTLPLSAIQLLFNVIVIEFNQTKLDLLYIQ